MSREPGVIQASGDVAQVNVIQVTRRDPRVTQVSGDGQRGGRRDPGAARDRSSLRVVVVCARPRQLTTSGLHHHQVDRVSASEPRTAIALLQLLARRSGTLSPGFYPASN